MQSHKTINILQQRYADSLPPFPSFSLEVHIGP